MSVEQEIWKDVVGFASGFYQVSNLGRVKSLPRLRNYNGGFRKTCPKILKQSVDRYAQVRLHDSNTYKVLLVHRLVAEAFIPNPHNKPTVNHKNGDKKDNRACNLEWMTRS